MTKKVIIGAFVFLLTGLTFNYKIVKYASKQAVGQLNIIYKAQSISKLIDSNTLSDSLKEQLLFIQRVKEFAEDSLHLAKTKNYETFFDADTNEINWLVMAAYPYELKSYEWHFPIAGNFPYLGYFNPKDAEIEANNLKQQGYDVRIGHPVAWSTLSILKDPVLSTMLRYSKGRVAEIIIHETTHATVYIKDNSELNENLANFVGQKGSLAFLASTYGLNSKEYLQYNSDLANKQQLSIFLHEQAQTLDGVYKNIETDSVSIKREKKIQTMDKIRDNFLNQNYSSSFKEYVLKDSLLYNNSFYTQFLLYNNNQSELDDLLQSKYHNSIAEFILDLKAGNLPKMK
jgi:predicted aminopeptidase